MFIRKRKSFIILAFIFILAGASLISAEIQYLCLEQGQTVRFSLCNSAIRDRTCGPDACNYCVDYNPITGVYCQKAPQTCHTQTCSFLNQGGGNGGGNGGGIGPNVTDVVLTNILTNPSLPLTFNVSNSKSVNVSFISNIYSLNYSLKLYKGYGTGGLSHFQNGVVLSGSSSPVKYNLPNNLPNGTYILNITASRGSASTTYFVGYIIIGLPSATINNTNSTNPQINQTTNNQTSNSSEWILTNIITSPSFNFNVMNGTEKELKIDFESNRYPLNITLKIDGINLDNRTISYQNITNSTNGTELIQIINITQINKTYTKMYGLNNYSSLYYNLTRDLLNGTYYANISFTYGNQTKISYLGQFNVGNYVEQVNNEEQTSGSSGGGGGGGGGGGSRTARSQNITNSSIINNSTTGNNQTDLVDEDESLNEENFISRITGAVTGAVLERKQVSIVVVLVIAIVAGYAIYAMKKRKTNSKQKNKKDLELVNSGKNS